MLSAHCLLSMRQQVALGVYESLTKRNAFSTPGLDAALTRSKDKTVIVPSHIFSTKASRIFLRQE